jgi:hypothetical protein
MLDAVPIYLIAAGRPTRKGGAQVGYINTALINLIAAGGLTRKADL